MFDVNIKWSSWPGFLTELESSHKHRALQLYKPQWWWCIISCFFFFYFKNIFLITIYCVCCVCVCLCLCSMTRVRCAGRAWAARTQPQIHLTYQGWTSHLPHHHRPPPVPPVTRTLPTTPKITAIVPLSLSHTHIHTHAHTNKNPLTFYYLSHRGRGQSC